MDAMDCVVRERCAASEGERAPVTDEEASGLEDSRQVLPRKRCAVGPEAGDGSQPTWDELEADNNRLRAEVESLRRSLEHWKQKATLGDQWLAALYQAAVPVAAARAGLGFRYQLVPLGDGRRLQDMLADLAAAYGNTVELEP